MLMRLHAGGLQSTILGSWNVWPHTLMFENIVSNVDKILKIYFPKHATPPIILSPIHFFEHTSMLSWSKSLT